MSRWLLSVTEFLRRRSERTLFDNSCEQVEGRVRDQAFDAVVNTTMSMNHLETQSLDGRRKSNGCTGCARGLVLGDFTNTKVKRGRSGGYVCVRAGCGIADDDRRCK